MISRNRSVPTAAAMSIECTTSANSTVTCLYSAGVRDTAVGDPHSSQNFALSRNSAPHLVQANAVVMPYQPIPGSDYPIGLTIGRLLVGYSVIRGVRRASGARGRPGRRAPELAARCRVGVCGGWRGRRAT